MDIILLFLSEILNDLFFGQCIFRVDCEEDVVVLETSNTRIIDTRILPLFEDEKVKERSEMLKHCNWYYGTVTISEGKIVEVGIGDDLDNYITCDVSEKLLRYTTDLMCDNYYTISCDEITKKCELIVDNDNMM